MPNAEAVLQQLDLAYMAALLQLIIIPLSAGTIVSLLVLRRKLGRVRVRRSLAGDSGARPVWKIVVTCSGKPVSRCSVRVDGNKLNWDGVGIKELDIDTLGTGVASLPLQIEPDSTVVVRSGSFVIFRGKFGELEDFPNRSGFSELAM